MHTHIVKDIMHTYTHTQMLMMKELVEEEAWKTLDVAFEYLKDRIALGEGGTCVADAADGSFDLGMCIGVLCVCARMRAYTLWHAECILWAE